jgi:hypothetical protein
MIEMVELRVYVRMFTVILIIIIKLGMYGREIAENVSQTGS